MEQNARHPPELGNLDAVLKFLHDYSHTTATPSNDAKLAVAHIDIDPSKYDPTTSKPTSLGDFNRCWEFLGRPLDAAFRKRNDPTASSSASSSGLFPGSNPPSSAPEDEAVKTVVANPLSSKPGESEDFDKFILKAKGVRWEDEPIAAPHSSKRGEPSAELPFQQETDAEIRYTLRSGKKVKVNKQSEQQSVTKRQNVKTTSLKKKGHVGPDGCVALDKPYNPGPVNHPQFLPFPPTYLDASTIRPILTLTFLEKKMRLVQKLKRRKLISPDTDYAGRLPSKERKLQAKSQAEGIHIFIDFSNIHIGFFQQVKKDRQIPLHRHTRMPPISFQTLAFILERNRPVARRVLAGSNGGGLSADGMGQIIKTRLPQNMLDAASCCYELNILEPVWKEKSLTPRPKTKGGKGNGYATSGHSSGSDAPVLVRAARQEQCVDEILQMKMLESLVDTETPSTMVLASGDAAEAEYSGGFLKTVERFLKRGWKVEVLAWSGGLSMEYRNREFLKTWEGKFKVIELDDFAEEMLAFYVMPCLVGDQKLGIVLQTPS